MERTRDCSTWFVMLNSLEMAARAGATMELETGEMNVKDETGDVSIVFDGPGVFLLTD